MVYRFKLVSDEVSNFSREIEIDSNATFLELRNVILDSVGYSKDELDSFFICDDDWTRREEVTQEDMGSSSDTDIWLMDETPLCDLIEDDGQKLLFVFDYMTERGFFMEMKESLPGRNLLEPLCTLKRGNAPEQYMALEEFEVKVDAAATQAVKDADDLDLDFYEETGYNDDEIEEGFDDLNLN